MNSMMPKRDMLRALRLTRDGKLKEAVSVLRGAPATAPRALPTNPGMFENLLHIPASVQDVLQHAGLRESPPAMPPGARFETRGFSNAAGGREYRLYTPSGGGAEKPLVVMLHGCTQSPEDFAVGTRMNELAERRKFLVAYPAQSRLANLNKCWNWFKPEDAARDSGEASIIAGIAQEIAKEFRVPRARIYAAGLSAGGAQAANLAASYPELFAGVFIHSGLASGAAHDLPSAMSAMRNGAPAAATRNGAKTATGGGTTPTMVFQGDADHTVNPANAERIVAAFGPRILVAEFVSGGGVRVTKSVYANAESWLLHGLGHGWSGGSGDGSFTEPRGPDASAEMVRFFGL